MPRLDSNSSIASSSAGGSDPSESFSNMWVEFLMKESSQGQGKGPGSSRRPSTSGQSDSGATGLGLGLLSPTRSDGSSGSAVGGGVNGVYGKRVASLGSLSAVDLSKPPGGESGSKEKPERRLL